MSNPYCKVVCGGRLAQTACIQDTQNPCWWWAEEWEVTLPENLDYAKDVTVDIYDHSGIVSSHNKLCGTKVTVTTIPREWVDEPVWLNLTAQSFFCDTKLLCCFELLPKDEEERYPFYPEIRPETQLWYVELLLIGVRLKKDEGRQPMVEVRYEPDEGSAWTVRTRRPLKGRPGQRNFNYLQIFQTELSLPKDINYQRYLEVVVIEPASGLNLTDTVLGATYIHLTPSLPGLSRTAREKLRQTFRPKTYEELRHESIAAKKRDVEKGAEEADGEEFELPGNDEEKLKELEVCRQEGRYLPIENPKLLNTRFIGQGEFVKRRQPGTFVVSGEKQCDGLSGRLLALGEWVPETVGYLLYNCKISEEGFNEYEEDDVMKAFPASTGGKQDAVRPSTAETTASWFGSFMGFASSGAVPKSDHHTDEEAASQQMGEDEGQNETSEESGNEAANTARSKVAFAAPSESRVPTKRRKDQSMFDRLDELEGDWNKLKAHIRESAEFILRVYLLSAHGLTCSSHKPSVYPIVSNLEETFVQTSVKEDEGVFFINDTRYARKQGIEPEFQKCYVLNCSFPECATLQIRLMKRNTLLYEEEIGRTTIDLERRWFNVKWQKWMEDNKVPIEARPLLLVTTGSAGSDEGGLTVARGALRLWVEILMKQQVAKRPIEALPSPDPEEWELRAVVWRVKNVRKENQDSVCIFVKGSYTNDTNHSLEQTTDTHYNSKDGTGQFNWRWVFRVTSPSVYPVLKVQLWEWGLTGSAPLSETTIDLTADLARAKRSKASLHKERTWVHCTHPAYPGESRGSVELELWYVPGDVGLHNPVGRGWEEPNRDPYLEHVTENRDYLNTAALLKTVGDIAGTVVAGAKWMTIAYIVAAWAGGAVLHRHAGPDS
ncbi:unnamed protein product [Vitrella brassicaformis CCMP3155]|uniref:C2 domain-containing protein n=3 Tax=Vitrella brassicaformis TaxID=1169539 RepID=A0A0G4F7V9_VITBC|nr:unnamed protein product [Vitrella brassicaformis CCMP3155]|eukprot:CEM08627.1 unnamed protein product [Vitrella brassicaformis CCMP3155]